MREDSSTQQPANRPSLAPHRYEPIPELEPSFRSPARPEQTPSEASDRLPAHDQAWAIADFPGNGESPAQPTGERPLPGRVPWMELVSDPGHPSTGIAISSSQPRLLPESIHTSPAETNKPDPALSLPGLIHDARNLVTTLDLYCDLLDTPGVLSPSCHHYAGELRLIAGGSRRILEKLAATESTCNTRSSSPNDPPDRRDSDLAVLTFPAPQVLPAERSAAQRIFQEHRRLQNGPELMRSGMIALKSQTPVQAVVPQTAGSFQKISDTVESFSRAARWRPFVTPQPIASLAEEVLANHNLLSALAGPGVTVGLSLYGGKQPIAMSCDDLTRILINLTKNATEAMPQGGHVQIALEEFSDRLCLSVSDSGSGLPEAALEEIFTTGYTTHVDFQDPAGDPSGRVAPHRGLGLAIVRSIVAAAGGSVTAANRSDLGSRESSLPCVKDAPKSGAIFRLDFPICV
jgi:signal transduction histidine kinase